MINTDWSFVAQIDNVQAGTNSKAYGLGVFNLSADRTRMWYEVISQDMASAITGIHLHTGAVGQSGGVAIDLDADVKGNVIAGWIAVDSSLLKNLLKGEVYVNIHNASNASGEIRGQLMPPRNLMAYSWIDGKQTGVTTNAKGVASLQANLALDTVWYNIVVDGLSDTITGIHLHYGAAGQSGGVAADLDGGVMGNHIQGTITGSALSKAFLTAWGQHTLNINIHTNANPNGEIRGQVMRLAREGFTISMDPMQNNVTGTNGMGSGYVSIDGMGNNAEVFIVMDNLTQQPSGIHFHSAPKGSSGGVLLDIDGWLTTNAKGGTVWGYWENNASTNAFTWANAMLFWHDSVYVNAHTLANPGGEIRGQVWLGSGCYAATTGIENVFFNTNNGNLTVYPNPANDLLNIVLPETITKGNVAIYNTAGSLVYNHCASSNQNQINAISLQPGIYYIRAPTGDKTYSTNFIKK